MTAPRSDWPDLDTTPCALPACGHPAFVHLMVGNLLVPIDPNLATCVSCPAHISAGGCPGFEEPK